jgi:hypothetical protein
MEVGETFFLTGSISNQGISNHNSGTTSALLKQDNLQTLQARLNYD